MYVFNALSTIFLLFGVVGFGTFVPKYFEYHFRKPASSSGKKNFLRSLSYSFAHLLHIFRYLRGRNASRPNLLFSFLKCKYSKLKIYAKKLLLTNWQPFKSLIRSFQKLVPPFHSQLYRLGPPPKRIIRSCQEIPVVWQKPFLQWSAFFSLALSFQSKWRGGNRLIRWKLLKLKCYRF